MKEVTVAELKRMKDSNDSFLLVDVREPYEADICSIGGTLIPMAEILNHTDEIPKDKKVIVHCRSGMRSANVINLLESKLGYTNLYNLKGGILAWANEIEPEMPKY